MQIRCGEVHLARVPREYWRDRLRRCHAMGLNTVCAYLFWNFHEPEDGKFDWQGQADAILHSIGQASANALVSIVDEQDRVVATTGHYAFNELLRIAGAGLAEGRHVETRDESIVAQAMAIPANGFDGLKLRCVIEQRVPGEREIAEMLSGTQEAAKAA